MSTTTLALEPWITNMFNDTDSQAVIVDQFVSVIQNIISDNQLQSFAKDFSQIDGLFTGSNSLTIQEVVTLISIIKNIIQTIYPILEELKSTVLTLEQISSIKTDLNLFIQVVILVILYKFQSQINITTLLPVLKVVSDIASSGLNLNLDVEEAVDSLGSRIKRFFQSLSCTHSST